MISSKRVLPVLCVLLFALGLSYYVFHSYKPEILEQVKGISVKKDPACYLDTVPQPTDATSLGRNVGDGYSQITASSSKSPEEVQRFFRSALSSKGWKIKYENIDSMSYIYSRDRESIEVNILNIGNDSRTVYSITYSE